ncbi:transglutaminase-like domain-containing protein [Geobacter sp. DSM 9736]|uniref:transglutaminase-like domain-containing protein n=1 Tax=Geobacter sp. DSM 9736 TaxID=1277350 RepID=UPI0012FD5D53|nr:transglutaminase-like domain-containing protein [Geobacter sp. DSM 9736]
MDIARVFFYFRLRPLGWFAILLFVAFAGDSACTLRSAHAAATVLAAPLTAPPLGERWFGISMNGEKTGFAYLNVTTHPQGYEIVSEGSVRMTVLGFSREASGRERYIVGKDLSLRSFALEQTIDGTTMRLRGEAVPKGINVVVETKGNRKERLLRAEGAVFPPPAVNIYPLLSGAIKDKTYQLQILDVEAVKIKKVKVTVLGAEGGGGGMQQTVHMQNDLYPVSNDVWVDMAGNTVRESVRDGLIETRAEPRQLAMNFLVEAAMSKKDFVLDFSRIPVTPPISRPQDLVMLKVELGEVPEGVSVPAGGTQRVERPGGGKVILTMPGAGQGGAALPEAEQEKYLSATERILPDNGNIAALKDRILTGETGPEAGIDILAKWVATNIKEAVLDSVSPLETLERGEGNCQAHARLYASLARAAGIPTKFVSGLVYLPDQGFLYHSWAESYAGGWIPVDPTFGQVPADVTHIKLAEGDSPGEMAPLVALIGRISARVVDKRYHEPVRPE